MIFPGLRNSPQNIILEFHVIRISIFGSTFHNILIRWNTTEGGSR